MDRLAAERAASLGHIRNRNVAMLTWQELIELEPSLQSQKVLSVYIDGTGRDPAARTAWRRALRGAIARLREGLHDASHEQREQFDACIAQLEEVLGAEGTALGSPGWMGFFVAGRAPRVEALPTPVPSLVTWDRVFRLAPAVGGAAEHPVAALALVDARLGRLYRLSGEQLELLETRRAEAHVPPVQHMGYPPRVGFHTGTRGTSGTDEAQRELRAGTEAMLRELAHRLEGVAGRAGCILLGGIPETVAELERSLSEPARARARRIAGVDVHATHAQLSATAIRERGLAEEDGALRRVVEVLERASDGGRGSVGPEATREALAERAVERLVFTPRFAAGHPAEAEEFLRAAHAQSAVVEMATGTAGARLDADAAGVGARLRFSPARLQPAVTAAEPVPA